MRLFVAVNFDDAVKSRLLETQGRIKAQSLKGNFSRPENLHLTLVFIGETPESQVQQIVSILENALLPAPFTLEFSHTGCFTHSKKELWWIGADKNDPGLRHLSGLRDRITSGLAEAGVKFDGRPFNAHITLGREIKHAAPIRLPDERVTVKISRVSLMNSACLAARDRPYSKGIGLGLHSSPRHESKHERGLVNNGSHLVYTELFGIDL
jgi:2'-5' RNA ligase